MANYLKNIRTNFVVNFSSYAHFILLGDFNMKPNEATMNEFCLILDCAKIIKDNN